MRIFILCDSLSVYALFFRNMYMTLTGKLQYAFLLLRRNCMENNGDKVFSKDFNGVHVWNPLNRI